MALTKFGGGITALSGSIAGNTYARNRYGYYVRSRTVPTNPRSAAQVKIRSCAATLKTAWLAMSAAERLAWGTYAANVSVVNRLGESIFLSGYNMFCRTNAALLYQDEAIIEDAPTTFTLGEQDPTLSIAAVGATGVVTVTFDDSMGWCAEVGGFMLLQQSKPQNPSINYFDGPWYTAGKLAGAVVSIKSPMTFTSAYTLAAGEKIFVQARILRAEGRLSNPFRAVCLCS